jgi:hypothetical protein
MNEATARQALELVTRIEEAREKQMPLLRNLQMWAELALQGYTHDMVDRLGTDSERVMKLVKDYERTIRSEARIIAAGEGLWRSSDAVKEARKRNPMPEWMASSKPPGGGGANWARDAWRPPVYTKVLIDGAWDELGTPVLIP